MVNVSISFLDFRGLHLIPTKRRGVVSASSILSRIKTKTLRRRKDGAFPELVSDIPTSSAFRLFRIIVSFPRPSVSCCISPMEGKDAVIVKVISQPLKLPILSANAVKAGYINQINATWRVDPNFGSHVYKSQSPLSFPCCVWKQTTQKVTRESACPTRFIPIDIKIAHNENLHTLGFVNLPIRAEINDTELILPVQNRLFKNKQKWIKRVFSFFSDSNCKSLLSSERENLEHCFHLEGASLRVRVKVSENKDMNLGEQNRLSKDEEVYKTSHYSLFNLLPEVRYDSEYCTSLEILNENGGQARNVDLTKTSNVEFPGKRKRFWKSSLKLLDDKSASDSLDTELENDKISENSVNSTSATYEVSRKDGHQDQTIASWESKRSFQSAFLFGDGLSTLSPFLK